MSTRTDNGRSVRGFAAPTSPKLQVFGGSSDDGKHRTQRLRRPPIRSFLVALALMYTAALPSKLGAAEHDDHVVETFDVASGGDLLLVPVALGDRQFQFVVDTGASFSLIDTALESYLERLPGFARVNGNRREKRFHLPAAYVGKSRQLLTGKAICIDLSQFREASGYDIRGIIGMDFLKAHVVHIDFDAGKLSILKRAPASAGSEFRMFYTSTESPALDVEIAAGDTVAFVLDTAMVGSALSLKSSRIDELMKNGRLEVTGRPPGVTTTLDGGVRLRGGRLDRFRLGDFTYERIDVSEGARNQIGLDLLARYIVTFDFPNDRLYLKRGGQFAEPVRFGCCGLALHRIDGKTRIKEVLEGYAGDIAGLKVGDEIVRFDRKDASSLSIFKMHMVLTTSGQHVRLDVKGLAGRREVDIEVSDSPAN